MEENILQEWENTDEQPVSDMLCPLVPVDLISTINEGDVVIEAETVEGEDTVIVLFDHDAPNNKYDVNIIEIGEQPLFKNDIPDTPFVITDEGYMDFIVSEPEHSTNSIEAAPFILDEHEPEPIIDPAEAFTSLHDEYELESTIIDQPVEAFTSIPDQLEIEPTVDPASALHLDYDECELEPTIDPVEPFTSIHDQLVLNSSVNSADAAQTVDHKGVSEPIIDLVDAVKSAHDESEPEPTVNLVEGLPSVPDKYELDLWKRTSCPHCHKTFKNPSSVLAHIIVHNGGKPFICEICGKRSKKEAEHEKHIHKHNQPTLPVIKICCEHCEMVFYRKRDFRKHYVGFHGIHRCRDCGQLFNRNTELVKHGRYNMKVTERAPCLKHTNSLAKIRKIRNLPKL